MHWLPEEVSTARRCGGLEHSPLCPRENLLTQIFRFFTQGGVDIAQGYIDKFMPVFKTRKSA
jgi:ribonucleoside-diphosphate reductase beta chain